MGAVTELAEPLAGECTPDRWQRRDHRDEQRRRRGRAHAADADVHVSRSFGSRHL